MSRDTKDTLIVTNCGAEAIAFLKVYGVIPAATAFMVTYTALANRVDSKVCSRSEGAITHYPNGSFP